MADNEISFSFIGDSTDFEKATDKTKDKIKEAGQSVEMLGDLIGVKIPDAVKDMLTSSEAIAPALEAAFVPLAVISLVKVIAEVAEKFAKWREEIEKAADDMTRLETASNNTLNSLDDKLLQAGIKADEFRNDHLAALKKQLELIDRQSMGELVHSLDTLSKAADVVFADLKSHWYTFGIGSDGAKHALTEFQTKYEALLAKDDSKGAHDLLAGTLKSAQDILAIQHEIDDQKTNGPLEYSKYLADSNTLQKAGVGITENEIKAQQALVDTLKTQVEVEEKRTALNNADRKQVTAEQNAAVAKEQQSLDASVAHAVHAHGSLTAAIKRLYEEQAQAGIDADLALAKSEEKRIAKINEDEKKAAKEKLEADQAVLQGEIADAKGEEEVTEATLQKELAQHKITKQQEIAAVADAKTKEVKQEETYLKKLQALYQNGTKQWQEVQNKINAIHREAIKAREKAETNSLKDQEQQYKQFFSQLGSAFTSNVIDTLKGTETIAQGFQKMYQSLISGLLNYLAQKEEKKAEEWAIDQIFGKRKAAANVAQAQSNVAVAGTEALASVPWPMNIAAAQETLGIGTGLEADTDVAFYALGGIVPQDGLAYLHKDEKVIPASMSGKGFSGNGAGIGTTVIVNHTVQAVDASSFQQHIRRHSNMIANEVTRALKRKA